MLIEKHQIENFLSECHLQFMFGYISTPVMLNDPGSVYIYHKKKYVGQFYIYDDYCVFFNNKIIDIPDGNIEEVCDKFIYCMNKIFGGKFKTGCGAQDVFPNYIYNHIY